jgi:hypothetical protein
MLQGLLRRRPFRMIHRQQALDKVNTPFLNLASGHLLQLLTNRSKFDALLLQPSQRVGKGALLQGPGDIKLLLKLGDNGAVQRADQPYDFGQALRFGHAFDDFVRGAEEDVRDHPVR